ncbi:MAG: prolyl oligopeptidase family serine peptidase [Caldilineales bacterium]
MKLICEPASIAGIPLLAIYPDGVQRAPIVFILHGFGGGKLDGLELAYRFASRGLFAVAFDAPHHGERSDGAFEAFDDPQRCDYHVESGFDRYMFMHRVVVETGRDLAALLDHFSRDARVAIDRCGVTGISMGAFSTFYAAANEPRVAAAAPIIGLPAFAERWEDALLEASTYVQWRDQLDAARPAFQRDTRFVQSIDPMQKLRDFYPRPLFMLCGDQDTHQPKVYSLHLYRQLLPVYAAQPERLLMKIYDGGRPQRHRGDDGRCGRVVRQGSGKLIAGAAAYRGGAGECLKQERWRQSLRPRPIRCDPGRSMPRTAADGGAGQASAWLRWPDRAAGSR